jgi:type IV pilus assembly protein PilA
MVLADGLKVIVADNAGQGSTDLGKGATLTTAADNSPNVTSTAIAKTTGVISVVTTSKAANGTVTFTPTAGGAGLTAGTPPDGILVWTCKSADIKQKYLPSSCTGI